MPQTTTHISRAGTVEANISQYDVRQRGDALALLRALPDACSPLVVFDPQYRALLDRQKYGNEGIAITKKPIGQQVPRSPAGVRHEHQYSPGGHGCGGGGRSDRSAAPQAPATCARRGRDTRTADTHTGADGCFVATSK
jgi:hypothetical protein